MLGLFLLAFVASAAATGNVYANSGCPKVRAVDNFNLESWGNGKWYELARYPNTVEYQGNCGWAEYHLTGDVFTITNLDVANGKLRAVTGYGKQAEDAGTTGKLIYTYPYGAGGKLTDNKLYVVYNDGDTGVLYHCEEDAEKKTRQDFSWVFSRTKTLQPKSKVAVEKFIKDNPFLDASKYIWPDFSDAACNYKVKPF